MDREKALFFLGLEGNASTDEMRTAYKQMAKMLHPDCYSYDEDLQSKATELVKTLNEAYSVLIESGSCETCSATTVQQKEPEYYSPRKTPQDYAPENFKVHNGYAKDGFDSNSVYANASTEAPNKTHVKKRDVSVSPIMVSGVILLVSSLALLILELSVSRQVEVAICFAFGSVCSFVVLYFSRNKTIGFFDAARKTGFVGTISASISFNVFIVPNNNEYTWFITLGALIIYVLLFIVTAFFVGVGWKITQYVSSR